jgi:bifunctional aspartokinase / homoserine dehydrogenase 1
LENPFPNNLQIMSATIIRVEGESALHRSALENLKKFLQTQHTPLILVVSTLPGVYEYIENQICKVHEPGYSLSDMDSTLSLTGRNLFSERSAAGIGKQIKKLKNLLNGIHLTGDYSPELKDQILSFGEQLAAVALSEKLREIGVPADIIQPDELGLLVTSDPGNATYLSLIHPEILEKDRNSIKIIPGSFGVTAEGKIARTGISAADYTAAFITELINCERLILWNLNEGFSEADPSIVPGVGKLNRLTYFEASELAYFDHISFHPRTVEPLVKAHIPIHLINSQSDDFIPETIINSEDFISERVVKSVAATDDLCILRLNGPGVGKKPGILAEITGKLSASGINIKSVITSQVCINILLDSKSGASARKIATELGFTAVSEIEVLEKVSLIAIVGHGMQSHYGISATLFSAVARHQINVILSGSGASDLVSYLVVNTSDKEKSVKAIYGAFFKS